MAKDTSVIPHGQYCYTVITGHFLGLGMLTKPCPYWRTIPGQPSDCNGFCDYLETGDYSGDTMLLWDQSTTPA